MIFFKWKFWTNNNNTSENKTFINFLSNSDNENALEDLLKKKNFKL